MLDLQHLTGAVNEALGLIDVNPAEAAGVLRAALADAEPATAVASSLPVVGICSSCGGDVVTKPGAGSSCPCGFIMIPEQFRMAVASGA